MRSWSFNMTGHSLQG